MRDRGGRARRGLVIAAVAVCLLLVLQALGVIDPLALGVAPPERPGSGALAELEDALFAEMQAGATLRGLPGFDAVETGRGVLTGAVQLHVAGAGPRPLPGVSVQVLGQSDGGREGSAPLRLEQVSGADGTFTLTDVPAHVGYVLLVDHQPYRRIVLRGVSVQADRTTDVGVLLLGAPTTLAGQVVDARGRPIQGARVQVLPDRAQAGSFDARRALFELRAASTFVSQAEADASGRFLLSDLPPARYVLRVSAPGYATTFRDDVIVTADEHSTEVRVVLDPGSGFRGRVLDEDGRGVGGAHVIAIAIPGKHLARFDRIDVVAAADGTYQLDTLVSGMNYGVEAWAEGYAPTGRLLTTGEGLKEVDFDLVRSGRIAGRVTDEETGAGIAQAQVTVLAGPFLGVSPVSTVTDEAGAFAFEHVNPGPVVVFSAMAEGYQPGDKADFTSVNGMKVVPGETTWVDWTLRAGGAVRGRLTSDAGTPVPYASLALIDRRKSRQRWTGEITGMSDADGAYELIGVRPGTYDLHVDAAGYAPISDGDATKVVMDASLGVLQKDVVLARGATIRGRILAPDDAPVRGAHVWLEGPTRGESPTSLRSLQAVSDGVGHFQIRGVPPGMVVVVAADHDAFVSGRAHVTAIPAGQERVVEVRLGEGVSLSGRAVDARGAGIANARVRWGNIDGVSERDLRESFSADEFLGSRVLRTDGDGGFRIDRLQEGRLLLKIEHEDHAAWYRRDLMIGSSGEEPAITARLEATFTIRGHVQAGDTGLPIRGAFVYARERGPGAGLEPDPGRVQALVSAETLDDGSYVLQGVPPGLHEIVVWIAEGYIGELQQRRNGNVRRKEIAAGATGIDFRLDPILPPETRDD